MAKEEKRLNAWDKLMMAITFAEAGEHETAKNIIDPVVEKGKRPEKRSDANRPELRV
mgnify:CR=1 FL=1